MKKNYLENCIRFINTQCQLCFSPDSVIEIERGNSLLCFCHECWHDIGEITGWSNELITDRNLEVAQLEVKIPGVIPF